LGSIDREFLNPSFGLGVYRSSLKEGVYSPPFTKEVHRSSLSGSILASFLAGNYDAMPLGGGMY